ncbi:MAG: thiamine pyrophosphate-dependent dehydrogenase E1 component subunit alpha [Dehalococcoidia bacterium]|nr:thiamine pyrophosphate-dependent dehydrogenase E1 component subunit alpha [Dehalococcoidia bacterium]
MTRTHTSRLGPLIDPNEFNEPLDLEGISVEQVEHWLRAMTLIRRAEESIGRLVESQEARCPCHLGIGQEAVAVGVAGLLRPTDPSFGAHRSHSHFLALGGSVDELMAEVLGKVTGCSRGFGGSMHLRDTRNGLMGTVPIVAATVPIAVGAALAMKLDGGDGVAVGFLGDGATEEGVFHESLNLAASQALPVIFVIENNLYSSHLHISDRQPTDRTARFAEANEIDTQVIDGNDIVEVTRQMGELVTMAREQRRPALLEALTYRWRGHVGHREDEDVGVERTDNLAAWHQRDPIGRLSEGAIEFGLLDRQRIDAIDREAVDSVESALDAARLADFPPLDDLLGIVHHDSRNA